MQDNRPSHNQITRCGHVAIVGRPNVGKSTLLNALIGTKISPICNKPQTTWHNIRGILTEHHAQIIFVDTPGIHFRQKPLLNKVLKENAFSALNSVDIILYLVGGAAWHEEDDYILSLFKDLRKPFLLGINKIDLVRKKSALLPVIEMFAGKHTFDEVLPISAMRSVNLDTLKHEIRKRLPLADYHYSEEEISDQSIRFFVTERIREQFVRSLGDELPYSLYIELEEYKEQCELVSIAAVVWVARSSQRAIVIGRQGMMLKKVGIQARKSIERFIDKKVFLRLWVKEKIGWQDNPRIISYFNAHHRSSAQ